MNKQLIEVIKRRGYWRINFRPVVYEKEKLTFDNCKKLIESNLVQFRGWNYPHFPRTTKETGAIGYERDYIAGWVNWDYNKEFWHMYQSGQFLHYLGLREDWFDESQFVDEVDKQIKPGAVLEISSAIFQITEVYEFLSRLSQSEIYNDGVIVDLSLINTKDRVLIFRDKSRHLNDEYKTSMESISFNKQYNKDDLIVNSTIFALHTIHYFFERFGWITPPMHSLKNIQEEILRKS